MGWDMKTKDVLFVHLKTVSIKKLKLPTEIQWLVGMVLSGDFIAHIKEPIVGTNGLGLDLGQFKFFSRLERLGVEIRL